MIKIRYLGIQPYEKIWDDMKLFTSQRDAHTPDELWLLEHTPTYTQGQAGKAEHVLHASKIPIVYSDRGGQVTYHGPGQLVVYVLLDICRRSLSVRTLVTKLEQGLIALLDRFDISANSRCGAPGVYVDDKKIASIGLRVKNGCSYHGLALNVAMNLAPFANINPCGYAHLQMTQVQDFIPEITLEQVRNELEPIFLSLFAL